MRTSVGMGGGAIVALLVFCQDHITGESYTIQSCHKNRKDKKKISKEIDHESNIHFFIASLYFIC